MIALKSAGELTKIRRAGQVVAGALDALNAAVCPGIETQALDALAQETVLSFGGQPAFKGYQGFPASLCCSVNEEVVHGIPSERRLREGDIVSLDLGAVVEGYYADAAITVAAGRVSDAARRLMAVTEQALYRGIAMARPGRRLSDISAAIQQEAEAGGFSVVREFVGHGIGVELHEPPQIPNYGKPGYGPELAAGMVLAIEPMVNEGEFAVKVLSDGWTAVTRDGKRSAHFEHTIAITESEPEILTGCQKKKPSK